MPLYEYECDVCGHRFEKILKFSDPPIEICPKCGGPVRKLIASPAFHLKGSGWYVTDYAKKDSVPTGKSGGGKDESSEGPVAKKEKESNEAKASTDKTETSPKESSAKSDSGSSGSAAAGASGSAPAKTSKPDH